MSLSLGKGTEDSQVSVAIGPSAPVLSRSEAHWWPERSLAELLTILPDAPGHCSYKDNESESLFNVNSPK